MELFSLQKLVSCIQLRRFAEGEKTAQKMKVFTVEGRFNWQKLQKLRYMLAMHSQNYQQAYTVFGETLNNKGFA